MVTDLCHLEADIISMVGRRWDHSLATSDGNTVNIPREAHHLPGHIHLAHREVCIRNVEHQHLIVRVMPLLMHEALRQVQMAVDQRRHRHRGGLHRNQRTELLQTGLMEAILQAVGGKEGIMLDINMDLPQCTPVDLRQHMVVTERAIPLLGADRDLPQK